MVFWAPAAIAKQTVNTTNDERIAFDMVCLLSSPR